MNIKHFTSLFFALILMCAVSCGEDPIQPDGPVEKEDGITNIDNSYADRTVTYRGATITVKFDAAAAWTAELKLKTDAASQWAVINPNSVSGEAKKQASVRIAFEKNNGSEERSAELWITAEGYDPMCVATLTQAASSAVDEYGLHISCTFIKDDPVLILHSKR